MASQELYSNVTDQLEAAMARLTEAVAALDWQAVAREAAVVSEIATIADAVLAEIDA